MINTNKNVFFQINEEDHQRIVNIEDIHYATFDFRDPQVTLFWNDGEFIFFRGEQARRLWQILSDFSILIYDFEASKNVETSVTQDFDVPPNE